MQQDTRAEIARLDGEIRAINRVMDERHAAVRTALEAATSTRTLFLSVMAIVMSLGALVLSFLKR